MVSTQEASKATAQQEPARQATARPEPVPDSHFDVRSPTDGRVLAQVRDTEAAEVARAAAELRSAQGDWERLGPRRRAGYLLRFRDWLLDNEEHLLDVMQAESGKVRQDAAVEIAAATDTIAYFARRAEHFLRARHPRPHSLLTMSKALTVAHRPYPLVGVITPWNFPLLVPVVDAAPALLAGASVIIKPSEVTPLTAVEIGRGWREIGAPDVLRVITGQGATGGAVVDHADYIQFTGSTRTGRVIATRAAERLVPCSLELGGKDAMIVLDDADVDLAVSGALWGGFFNSGQVCTSVERVYVEQGIYDAFVAALTERAGRLRHGPDSVAGVNEVGAMANDAQVAIVKSHVDDAVALGARVLLGGSPGDRAGSWYQPTLLVDVDGKMKIMREETFGPTLPIMKVRDAEEAITAANDTSYGLSATIWTKNRRRGALLARRIEAGAVNVNDVFANILAPPVPMSGWRESGIGFRFGGAQGLLRFCRSQAITVSRFTTPADDLLRYPYSPERSRLLNRIVRFAVASGRRRFGRRATPG